MIHPDVSRIWGQLESLGGAAEPAAAEMDNGDYGAAVCRVGSQHLRFRVARVTPSKVGLFVAVWRRSPTGATEPFPHDDVDHLVIVTTEGRHTGQFVFPRSALQRHGITSLAGRGGKRGFRVYPPWSHTDNAQAIRTQAWQGEFFVDTAGRGIDLDRLRALLRL